MDNFVKNRIKFWLNTHKLNENTTDVVYEKKLIDTSISNSFKEKSVKTPLTLTKEWVEITPTTIVEDVLDPLDNKEINKTKLYESIRKSLMF